MSSTAHSGSPRQDLDLELSRTCQRLGRALRTGRKSRGWSASEVAAVAGLSRAAVLNLESGRPGGLLTYLRVAEALGLRLDIDLAGPASPLEVEDAVHAVMGEVQARRLGTGLREVLVDEPYQRFRFAGRADLVVVDRPALALHHSENKTRIVNVGEMGGSFNAKCLWLGEHVAERYRLRRLASETHVLVLLWSEEVLAAARTLARTLRSFGPDGTRAFCAWWGGSPLPGMHRGLVFLDPIDRGSGQPQWVGLEEALESRPRYQGYQDAFEELRRSGLA